MKILAIDDEPKALRLLRDAIAAAEPDAEITDFTDGADALQALRRQELTPDVVFSDIELPGMTGLAFAMELKKLSPETKIIFVTGFPKYAAEAYMLHVSGYIVKRCMPIGSGRSWITCACPRPRLSRTGCRCAASDILRCSGRGSR